MSKGLIKKSRTLDFNAIFLVTLALEQNLPILENQIPVTFYPYILFALIIANVILRFMTSGPVGDKS